MFSGIGRGHVDYAALLKLLTCFPVLGRKVLFDVFGQTYLLVL